MIALPWWARMAFDTSLIFGPALLIYNYPRGVTTFLDNSRRRVRRKEYDQVVLRDEQVLTTQEVQEFFRNAEFKEWKN